jgi:serine/threonine protein kinase/tetratricopeptide (TPR) repeat protein
MTLPSGHRLGPYEIVSPIGAGGMGEVLKANDTRLQRTVAIKVLPPELASDAERRSRFEREAHAASALNHPNITTVFDIGEDEGTHYIVMELVEGKTLRELMDEGPLSTETMLPLATQIAEGLAKAHGAGIVHRDLKPENLMVTDDGLVKILDFGLAKLMPQGTEEGSEAPTETRATRQGAVLGTVPYMSPEQAAGRALDFHSDQFSLGSILYEMATGKRAFRKDTMPETLAAIIREDPEPIRKLNDAVPVELKTIIERCLAKDPARRYESTSELARELHKVPEAPSPWRARRKILWASASLFVALLAVVLGPNLIGLWDRLSSRTNRTPIESIVVLPLRNLSGDPEQDYFVDGMTEALITNPTKVSALKVIARHSAMRYRNSALSLVEIARELGVDAVVEGSALRAGDSVRIMAQLIDPRTEQALWAESYERDLENVLILQGEVAQAIAAEVEVALTPEETRRLADARAVNPEAYDAYLKGSYQWMKFVTPGDLDTAEKYFDLALEKDPSYAPAYAGRAWVWLVRTQWGWSPPEEGGPKAKAAALRAIELDENSAGAYEALATVRMMVEWDWDGAREPWRRSLEINPNVASAQGAYAHFLIMMGHGQEALIHSERAVALDPFNPLIRSWYAAILYSQRRYDEAIAEAREALRYQPDFPVATNMLWWALHEKKGMEKEALEAARVFARITYDDPRIDAALSEGYAQGGYAEAMKRGAEALIARLPETFCLPSDIAGFYAMAGEDTKAVDWLEKGLKIHDPLLPYLGARYPLLDRLRSDPRFQDLLRRVNLPTTSAGPEAGETSVASSS